MSDDRPPVPTLPFPEPTDPVDDPRDVLLGYLAYFRAEAAGKLAGLAEADLRRSTLPTGWTPVELVHHLVHVERRWLEWGFEGTDVGDPWADERDGRWHLAAEVSLTDLLHLQAEQAARTESVVRSHALDDVGVPGERWDGAPPATLERVLLHLVQEHARHLGHLDVVCELLPGRND